MTNLEKAKLVYENQMWMAGNGHFNLSITDFAYILDLLQTKRTIKTLEAALNNFYHNHPDKIAIDQSFQEHYQSYGA